VQIFEIVPGVLIAKVVRKYILNCDKRFLFFFNWGEEILKIAPEDFIAKQGTAYILNSIVWSGVTMNIGIVIGLF
jgi:hypothetical protein